jgi:putative membrane protein
MHFPKPLLHIALNSFGTYIASILLSGFVVTGGVGGYIVIGLFISVLNYLIKPILKIVSLPFIFATLGLFLVIINAFLLYLVEYVLSYFNLGEISLAIDGLITYIVAALIYSVLHFVVLKFFR